MALDSVCYYVGMRYAIMLPSHYVGMRYAIMFLSLEVTKLMKNKWGSVSTLSLLFGDKSLNTANDIFESEIGIHHC